MSQLGTIAASRNSKLHDVRKINGAHMVQYRKSSIKIINLESNLWNPQFSQKTNKKRKKILTCTMIPQVEFFVRFLGELKAP